jgi:hypothetical protein
MGVHEYTNLLVARSRDTEPVRHLAESTMRVRDRGGWVVDARQRGDESWIDSWRRPWHGPRSVAVVLAPKCDGSAARQDIATVCCKGWFAPASRSRPTYAVARSTATATASVWAMTSCRGTAVPRRCRAVRTMVRGDPRPRPPVEAAATRRRSRSRRLALSRRLLATPDSRVQQLDDLEQVDDVDREGKRDERRRGRPE